MDDAWVFVLLCWFVTAIFGGFLLRTHSARTAMWASAYFSAYVTAVYIGLCVWDRWA